VKTIYVYILFDFDMRCVFRRQKIWGFALGSTVSHYATRLFSGIPESSEHSCRKLWAYFFHTFSFLLFSFFLVLFFFRYKWKWQIKSRSYTNPISTTLR